MTETADDQEVSISLFDARYLFIEIIERPLARAPWSLSDEKICVTVAEVVVALSEDSGALVATSDSAFYRCAQSKGAVCAILREEATL